VVVPPELIAKLNECAKTDFTGARDLWFSRQWWSSALVIVGLVFEGGELWYEMLSIVRGRVPRFRYRIVLLEHRVELAKVAAFVGWILIIAGLFGELRSNSKIEDLSASIQQCSDARVTEATLEAGDAAASAKTAHEEADAVKVEAYTIKERLNTASAQLGMIEERVRVQGPRWRILADNKRKFIDHLKPFSGSRVTVLMCGEGISPIEQYGTEQRLLELLGRSGSQWEYGYGKWTECSHTSSNGLEIVVGETASEQTKKAATALRDELLGIGIATSLDVVPLGRAKFMASDFGSDSPWAKTVEEPNTIFLLVAPSAMADSAKPNKKEAKTPQ